MGDTDLGWPQLTAELWCGKELVATRSVEVVINEHDYVALSAEVFLGILDRGHPPFTWIVRRDDGSLFERRPSHSFRLRSGPGRIVNGVESRSARDLPCSAHYAFHTSVESMSRIICDPLAKRDLVRFPHLLDWIREGSLA